MDDPSIRELLPPLREPAITAASIKEEEVPRSGIPTLTPLGIVDSRSEIGGAHIDYSSVIPASGRELCEWYLTAKQRTMDSKFDFFFRRLPHLPSLCDWYWAHHLHPAGGGARPPAVSAPRARRCS
ncbi:hypothetical protein IFM61392_03219 [Aspergillus lentulus]|nr:hypothetical protein IFM62136_03733 [Aspergillus lentulus]GFG04233.1 hypothetical protein IFM61392_03219 [Aspergillus lentulus]